MKKSILFLVAAAFVTFTGCRKIEVDGEKEVIIVDGGGNNGTVTGKTVYLKGTITADTTLRTGNTYILQGPVVVDNNKTMTVQPGTIIKGAYSGSDVGFLVITRGSKIVAQGTPDDPIIFTSASKNPQSGDWGGIIICGKAAINQELEGKKNFYLVEGLQGLTGDQGKAGSGDNNPIKDDSSGVLSYVRIEYAGYGFTADKEINSLTLAAVGNRTKIDHVQVAYAKDDAFEWFGGSVNCKYLIAYKTQDDDFDSDLGYDGNVQFGLIVRDSVIADISKSESFESDNDGKGTTAAPKTAAVFSNITSIGPRATLNNIGSSFYLAGAQIRRNSAISIFNSIFMGWPTGILIDASTGTPTDLNINDNSLRIKHTTLAGNNIPIRYDASTTAPTGMTNESLLTWFTQAAFGNTIVTNASDAKLIQPFNYGALDPTPFAGSSGYAPIVSGGNFDDSKLANPFFSKVNFRGAIAPGGVESTWWKGWTKFNY